MKVVFFMLPLVCSTLVLGTILHYSHVLIFHVFIINFHLNLHLMHFVLLSLVFVFHDLNLELNLSTFVMFCSCPFEILVVLVVFMFVIVQMSLVLEMPKLNMHVIYFVIVGKCIMIKLNHWYTMNISILFCLAMAKSYGDYMLGSNVTCI
jgi:hypothetical protein